MVETLASSIQVTPEQWQQIERVGRQRETSANRLDCHDLVLDEGCQMPQSVELFERVFRGVRLLALPKHEELERAGMAENFEEAAGAARILQDRTFGMDDESGDE